MWLWNGVAVGWGGCGVRWLWGGVGWGERRGGGGGGVTGGLGVPGSGRRGLRSRIGGRGRGRRSVQAPAEAGAGTAVDRGRHQFLAEARAAGGRADEDVGQVSVGHAVGDRAGEADQGPGGGLEGADDAPGRRQLRLEVRAGCGSCPSRPRWTGSSQTASTSTRPGSSSSSYVPYRPDHARTLPSGNFLVEAPRSVRDDGVWPWNQRGPAGWLAPGH